MAKLYSYSRFLILFLVLISYQNCGEISLVSRASVACDESDASCNPEPQVNTPKDWDFEVPSGLCDASIDKDLALLVCQNYNGHQGLTFLTFTYESDNWIKKSEQQVCNNTFTYQCQNNAIQLKNNVVFTNHLTIANGNGTYLKTVGYEYVNGAWVEQLNPLIGNYNTKVSKGSNQWAVTPLDEGGIELINTLTMSGQRLLRLTIKA